MIAFYPFRKLERKAANRPAGYLRELDKAVVKRTNEGVYLDRNSTAFREMWDKYRGSAPTPQKPSVATPREIEGLLDFVWPYFGGKAKGDELRYSLRSVAENFNGIARVLVIGDKPKWYRGPFIRAPQIRPRLHHVRLDRAHKMGLAIEADTVAERFCWMMDDVYFCRPFGINDLLPPCYKGVTTKDRLAAWNPKHDWGMERRKTFLDLLERGLPLLDYCSHMPLVYDKSVLRQMRSDYRMEEEAWIDELLYWNRYAVPESPREARGVIQRTNHETPSGAVQDAFRRALVVNHTSAGYTPGMQAVLAEKFSSPSPWETRTRSRLKMIR